MAGLALRHHIMDRSQTFQDTDSCTYVTPSAPAFEDVFSLIDDEIQRIYISEERRPRESISTLSSEDSLQSDGTSCTSSISSQDSLRRRTESSAEDDKNWKALQRPKLPRRKKKRSIASILSEKIRSRSKQSSEYSENIDLQEGQEDVTDTEDEEDVSKTTGSRLCPEKIHEIDGNIKGLRPIIGNVKKTATSIFSEREYIAHLQSLPRVPPPPPPLPDDDDEDNLHNCSWFHDIDMDIANIRLIALQKEGGFLVRRSRNPSRSYPYVLMIYHMNRIANIPLRHSETGWTAGGCGRTSQWAFKSVQALISYSKRNNIGLRTSCGTDQVILTVTPNKC